MALRVSYRFFWPGFDPKTCLFTFILEKKLGLDVEIVSSGSRHVDLEICSVFPFDNLKSKVSKYAHGLVSQKERREYVDQVTWGFSWSHRSYARRVVWFTGENRRAPHGLFDGCLSFDSNDERAQNIYFPFWMYRVDWGQSSHDVIKGMTPEHLVTKRKLIIRKRNCCTFSSTREPFRMKLLDLVEDVMPLDRFGSAFGSPVIDKLHVSQDYGFQVCPENDLYPGYVTEKVLESWFAGNIPIWHGLDAYGCFNKSAIIDVTTMSDEEIKTVLSGIDEDMSRSIRCQPILQNPPTLFSVQNLFSDLLL